MSYGIAAPVPAGARANVAMATFMEWLNRGAVTTSGKYSDFLHAVLDAEAQAVLMAVRTVRLAIVGGWHKLPMRDKDGNYVFKRDSQRRDQTRRRRTT